MLFQLPTFRATLNACSVDRATFTAHPAGRFCGQCQRVVQDFSQSADPIADLAAARAASPDGRVCGTFRRAQVAPAPTLTRRLRWFVMALVLVMGQGLTAREALAQVRKPVPHKAVAPRRKYTPVKKPKHVAEAVQEQIIPEEFIQGGVESVVMEETLPLPDSAAVYGYVEQMPEAPQGGGMAGIVAYFQKNIHVSRADLDEAEGKAFVHFVVTETGAVANAQIIKSSGSDGLDAAVLQAARNLTGLRPGRQNGRPVKVSINLPIDIKPQ
ncbi:energy transducer TonB [Hymenobacter monticola]|uniref:TonB family protein n=1 Tax=Hymenobacter monticola TaxID=1705399 RepID=A0ABY4B6V4_9BACT|nr:energy transducer TonB [Hymenobacter monticola]UOE34599.1 TonB family protein [Hymenobacter monticola]